MKNGALTWSPKQVKLSDLKENPANPKIISEQGRKRLQKSLSKFGLAGTVICNTDLQIIDGHSRKKELLSNGLTPKDKIWVSIPNRKLTAKEYAEFNAIIDVAKAGEPDVFLMEETFGDEFMTEWELEGKPKVAQEDYYKIPDEIHTDIVLGDLFQIGQHRLLCGDSLNSDNINRLTEGEKIDLVYADPPYGIEIVSVNSKVGGGKETTFGATGGGGGATKAGKNKFVDSNVYSEIIGDETTDTAKEFYNVCHTLQIKNLIFWGGNYYSDFLPITRCWFVWDKEMTGNFSEAEMAWTSFEKGGIRVFKYLWNGLSREGSRNIEGVKRMHPTQKPVGLAMMIFQRFDYLKTIFDGFLGSGTTMVAAHQLNRRCFGMEIDPKYCQVIIDRMRKLDNSLKITRNGSSY